MNSEKPEDVPQWAWDAAEDPAQTAFDASVDLYETGMESANVQLIFARALLKTREEAVNEAADLVEWRFKNRMWRERDGIAVRELAIRLHSQKGEK